jgi:hypothetical protein
LFVCFACLLVCIGCFVCLYFICLYMCFCSWICFVCLYLHFWILFSWLYVLFMCVFYINKIDCGWCVRFLMSNGGWKVGWFTFCVTMWVFAKCQAFTCDYVIKSTIC